MGSRELFDFRFLEAQGIFKQNLMHLYVYISAIFGIIFLFRRGALGGQVPSLVRGSFRFTFSRSLRCT